MDSAPYPLLKNELKGMVMFDSCFVYGAGIDEMQQRGPGLIFRSKLRLMG